MNIANAVQRGSWVHVYNDKNQQLFVQSAGNGPNDGLKGYTSNSPQGFPKESPACPGSITGEPHDGAALQLEILTPTNAQGFSFSFNFFTYEWPDFICSTFNDFFVSLLMPFPANQPDGNISFDSQGNPVSVNNAFLEVCGCPGGPPRAGERRH